jgi:hypothetical protein
MISTRIVSIMTSCSTGTTTNFFTNDKDDPVYRILDVGGGIYKYYTIQHNNKDWKSNNHNHNHARVLLILVPVLLLQMWQQILYHYLITAFTKF